METGVEIIASPLDLVPVVARARTVVVPQVWGTSSKLKMAAALASGRRVVASPTATVGLPDALANYVDIAQSVDEWHRPHGQRYDSTSKFGRDGSPRRADVRIAVVASQRKRIAAIEKIMDS